MKKTTFLGLILFYSTVQAQSFSDLTPLRYFKNNSQSVSNNNSNKTEASEKSKKIVVISAVTGSMAGIGMIISMNEYERIQGLNMVNKRIIDNSGKARITSVAKLTAKEASSLKIAGILVVANTAITFFSTASFLVEALSGGVSESIHGLNRLIGKEVSDEKGVDRQLSSVNKN